MAKIITNTGLTLIVQRLKGSYNEPVYIGWGTGTTQPSATDTTLQSEDTSTGYSRSLAISSIGTTFVSNDTYIVAGSLVATSSITITEWGLFDASTSGHMILREVVSPGYSLNSGGMITYLFKITPIRS